MSKRKHDNELISSYASRQEVDAIVERERHAADPKWLLEDAQRRLQDNAEIIAAGETAKAERAALENDLKVAERELQHEQTKADEQKFAALESEFDAALDALDRDGSTPALEQKVFETLAAFRMAGRSGQSYEAARHYVDRMKGGGIADRKLRWSGLRSWIKRTPAAAAA